MILAKEYTMTLDRPISSVWARAREAAVRHLFLDRQAAFWMRELDPILSTSTVRARVVGVVAETADTKTFALQPNALWRPHRAGQHTLIEVEIDGVRQQRCYSIASAPGRIPIEITVKRVSGGRVSSWMHEQLHPGDIVGLGQPVGEFVLPTPTPNSLLLLSGGSGITPVMSILRDLAARDAIDDVVFVHHARSRADVIFNAELEHLAARHPGLRLIVCLDDEPFRPKGFDETRLRELVPDFAERSTYLCGPAAMMERAERLWQTAGATHRLARERFVAAARLTALAGTGEDVDVVLSRSGRTISSDGDGSLLDQLERAGERPASGCRMGICHTCTCRKTSGTVQNLLTGEVSNAPDEDIQLCISAPRSDLELEL